MDILRDTFLALSIFLICLIVSALGSVFVIAILLPLLAWCGHG